ncbi:hypothetical protein Tco_0781401 [Tanacetum coccineum]
MFGKVENYEDEDVCSIDFETEFPAIVFDNTLPAIPSEPTVCPPNENKIDFRISFDESDDEDYTVIFDENSFLYKIIYVNDLKTDLKNDNNKMPLSPNPTIDYFDDLDYFKDFKNKFPAIVYNDGLTSKSDLEPLVNSERIDEFNLIDGTSLSEYDEEIVSRFNDLFNVIHPDDSKSKKDNYDNDVGIMQSSEGDEITHGENGLSETSHDKIIKTFETGSFVINLNIVIREYYVNEMLVSLIINLYVPFGIPFDPKRYYKDGSHTKVAEAKIDEYTKGIRHSYEQRLETIWSRPINQVHILDFKGLTPRDEVGSGSEVEDDIFWRGAIDRDFLCPAPSYVLIRDPVRRLCYRMITYSISSRGQALEKYLFRHADGRKSGARLLGGHFIRHLVASILRLVSDLMGLRGLHVPMTREASAAAAGVSVESDEAGQAAEEAALEIPAPAQAPPPPPPAPQPRTMSHRIERLEEEVHDLRRDVVSMREDVAGFTTEQSRVSNWMISA